MPWWLWISVALGLLLMVTTWLMLHAQVHGLLQCLRGCLSQREAEEQAQQELDQLLRECKALTAKPPRRRLP